MSADGAPWQALPVEIGADELESWARRVPSPLALTGATGFVGSHVLGALLRTHRPPRILVRDTTRLCMADAGDAEIVVGDLDDAEALATLVAGCGSVIHLAGLVRAASEAAFQGVNRAGTENLVRVMRDRAPSARLIHVSSLAAAGPSADPGGINPDDEPRPVSAYGRSKLAGELAVRRHTGPWAILRPPAIYGPRDIDVLQFFRLAARGFVPIPAGERWVTVAYVSDVVRGVLAAAAGTASGRVLHLGEPEPRRLDALIGALAESGGVRARVVRVPAGLVRMLGVGGDALQRLGLRRIAMTSDKARELLARHWSARTEPSLVALGLSGFVPLAVGAAATWAWYRRAGWVRAA